MNCRDCRFFHECWCKIGGVKTFTPPTYCPKNTEKGKKLKEPETFFVKDLDCVQRIVENIADGRYPNKTQIVFDEREDSPFKKLIEKDKKKLEAER